MASDALSLFNSNRKLILKTNFGTGVSLDPVLMLGTSGNWVQGYTHVAGTDAGYNYDTVNAIKAYFGSQCKFLIQQLPLAAITDVTSGAAATTLATLFTVQIQATTMTVDSGGKELLIKLIKRNASGSPQADLQIIRYRDDFATTNAIPLPRIKTLAWRFDCILDSNLDNLLANDSDYAVLTEYKTGDSRSSYPSGAFSTSVGSSRFSILIHKGASGLYFSSRHDNVAGTAGIYPTNYNSKPGFFFAPFTLSTKQINVNDVVRGKTSGVTGTVRFADLRVNTWTGGSGKGVLVIKNANGTFTDGEILQVQIAGVWTDAVTVAEFWSGQERINLSLNEQKYLVNNTAGGTVPLNTPIRIEVRVVLPQSREDITTGITQAVMTDLSTGARLTLCDFRGGIQMGACEDPITRHLILPAYTGLNNAAYPGDPSINVSYKVTNLEIWDDFPEPIIN